jgi:hypothetical protein
MATYTTRLGLKKPAGVDPFLRQDFEDNWEALDLAPGLHICTSGSRPSWAAALAGRCILETDTGSIYRWTGSTWHQVKQSPNGWNYLNNWANETISPSATPTKTITTTLNSSTPGNIFFVCASSVQYPRGSVQEIFQGFQVNDVNRHNGERSMARWAIPTGSIPGSPDNNVQEIVVMGSSPINVGNNSLKVPFEVGNGANAVTIRYTRTIVWMVNTSNQ